jgi:hypothetical protein
VIAASGERPKMVDKILLAIIQEIRTVPLSTSLAAVWFVLFWVGFVSWRITNHAHWTVRLSAASLGGLSAYVALLAIFVIMRLCGLKTVWK